MEKGSVTVPIQVKTYLAFLFIANKKRKPNKD